MNILIMGPPGSGKSTQGELLAKKLEVPFIQMGSEVNRVAQEPTPRGRKIKKLYERGALIDDKEIKNLLGEIILSKRCKHGFVLDGAPRVMSQVDEIEDFVRAAGGKVDTVILVQVSDQECLKRLLKRKRLDDKAKTIKSRLKLYHRNQGPVIDYYRKKGILLEINGERPIEVIFKDIVQKLKSSTPGVA